MAKQIEDLLFSGPCDSIENFDQPKCMFCDAAATLHAHEISKITAQCKKAIKNEVNSLLLGSDSNKRREIDENKKLCALRLGDHKEKKTQEECIPLKVWKVITPESRIAMRSVEEVTIGLVKDSTAKIVKHVGEKMSQQNNNSRSKLL